MSLTIDSTIVTIDATHFFIISIDRTEKLPHDLRIVSIDITKVTRVGLSDGQLEITVTGGDGNYEYSIDNITWQASNTFIGLAVETYTVYVRDGQTVPFTDQFTIDVETIYQNVYYQREFSSRIENNKLSSKITTGQNVRGIITGSNIVAKIKK